MTTTTGREGLGTDPGSDPARPVSAGLDPAHPASGVPGGQGPGTAPPSAPSADELGRRGSTATRILGITALLGLAATAVLGLKITPNDRVMGDLVRLLYVHPSVAWVAYMAFGITALASLCYLWPRTRAPFWDRIAASSAEIGVVFCALTLATGSIWGRPTWGVWWTWDACLTTTALLMALYVGYLALRRVTVDPGARARRSAVVALVAFADVPIDYLSVIWWHTLHQAPSVLRPGFGSPTIAPSMAWTLLLSFCSFTVLFAWLLVHRYQAAVLEARLEDEGMGIALAERWAEAAPAGSVAFGSAPTALPDGGVRTTAPSDGAVPTAAVPQGTRP